MHKIFHKWSERFERIHVSFTKDDHYQVDIPIFLDADDPKMECAKQKLALLCGSLTSLILRSLANSTTKCLSRICIASSFVQLCSEKLNLFRFQLQHCCCCYCFENNPPVHLIAGQDPHVLVTVHLASEFFIIISTSYQDKSKDKQGSMQLKTLRNIFGTISRQYFSMHLQGRMELVNSTCKLRTVRPWSGWSPHPLRLCERRQPEIN